ncbi:hypothetical protein [uncultured archaeal virus]|uniref:Uncharacterized protein n=1 Tax=uncultured archaeal virus TaxID=1960247 RepID=A0A8B0LP66_9VIRU|nr:hypothetical protein [uncultured archaeal virus]
MSLTPDGRGKKVKGETIKKLQERKKNLETEIKGVDGIKSAISKSFLNKKGRAVGIRGAKGTHSVAVLEKKKLSIEKQIKKLEGKIAMLEALK